MRTKNLTTEEARKVWLDALRSGKYKKGKGFLNVSNKFFIEENFKNDNFEKCDI